MPVQGGPCPVYPARELLSHLCQAMGKKGKLSLETCKRRQDLVPPAAPPKGDVGSRAWNAHIDHPRILCRGGPQGRSELPRRVLRQQLLRAGRQETVLVMCRCMCAAKVPSGSSASSSRVARQGMARTGVQGPSCIHGPLPCQDLQQGQANCCSSVFGIEGPGPSSCR